MVRGLWTYRDGTLRSLHRCTRFMLFGQNLNGVHYFVLGCIFINKLFKNLSALKGSYVIAHHPTPLPTCESMVHFHWILILVFINLVPFAKFLPIYRIAQCQVKNWHVYNHETALGLWTTIFIHKSSWFSLKFHYEFLNQKNLLGLGSCPPKILGCAIPIAKFRKKCLGR